MFYTHGNPIALVVTQTGSESRQNRKRVTGPHAALDWCIKHRAKFVYLPAFETPATN